ncbi:MAG: nucleotidyltransferase domain-containing protein [Ruminococcus sp.]|jgi:predicted nucleotidyltransferase|nr:nucleotidyltransferase domain-containing protein [Ruminococcus sp.]
MVYTIEEIKERIKPVAEKYNLPAVYLFGSYARGEANEKSDIDLMIDRTGTAVHGLLEYAAVFDDMKEHLGKEIDMITTYALEYSRDYSFKQNVESEKVSIYGTQPQYRIP